MNEITSIDDIQSLAVAGLTDWKRYGDVSVNACDNLLIFNYTPAAQFGGRWNFFERVSRGLIVNRATGEIVARPFDKFFNWGEGGRVTDARIMSVTEKMDGSLGILYRYSGRSQRGVRYQVATRGAFASDQAVWATEYLNDHDHDLSTLQDHWTLLFEIIYPGNRVVVDYASKEALILLAARNRFSGEYAPFRFVEAWGNSHGFETPREYDIDSVDDLLALKSRIDANREGWVVTFADGQRFKFKGDEYMKLHKIISGLSFRNTLEAVRAGTVSAMRERIPDEFIAQFDGWVGEIGATVEKQRRMIAEAYSEAPKTTRKDFALWVTREYPAIAPYLFATHDGKDVDRIIYKMAFDGRPDERALRVSEATA